MRKKRCLIQVFILWTLSGIAIQADNRPNLIFLMTDDQRADSLGCMGNRVIQTPNIDVMASDGLVFENAFVTTAICMTSRACVLTGQYAARHGILSFSQELSKEQLSETYLSCLRQANYRTGFIGKWGVGDPRSANDLLDYNRGFPGQSRYFKGDLKQKQGRHLTAQLGDQAIEFLAGCSEDQPFHLSVSFKAPHCQDSNDIYSDQFPADRAFDSLYRDLVIPRPPASAAPFFDRLPPFLKNSMNRDRWAVRFRSPEQYQKSVKDYYRLISGVDRVVGRIRHELERLGFADNTVIIYTSDHGFFLGEYGFAGKWTPHDVSIRIPLIIHDPRSPATERGQRYDQMALGIDLAPTLLDYAQIDAPESMQGSSLRALIGHKKRLDWRQSFFYEHWFSAGGRIAPCEGVRGERWKYARYLKLGKEIEGEQRWEELYDLTSDPDETVNLAQDPAFANELERQRIKWQEWRQNVRQTP
ncbi:MAG: sulfatase [Planctomycetaceae bacterium]|nr:sulfatase [Planctomycetaceae bacterium]